MPGDVLKRAVILDLRGSICESLQHLRRSSVEWPACIGRSGNDLPHPILFFVATKENGSAYSGRSGDKFRVFVTAKKNGPPATTSLLHERTARRQNDRCGCRRGRDATEAA